MRTHNTKQRDIYKWTRSWFNCFLTASIVETCFVARSPEFQKTQARQNNLLNGSHRYDKTMIQTQYLVRLFDKFYSISAFQFSLQFLPYFWANEQLCINNGTVSTNNDKECIILCRIYALSSCCL